MIGTGTHKALTHSQVVWSCFYWGVWIGGLFLIPELLGLERIAPWVTLSETSWWLEKTVPIVATILSGFLLGLLVHIRYGVNFGKAELGGLVVAFVVHILWGAA